MLGAKHSRRDFLAGSAALFASAATGARAAHVPSRPPGKIAFVNARIFDGKGDTLKTGAAVIVDKGQIAAVDAARNPPGADFQVIDCAGRCLIPGLIDNHWHAMMAAISMGDLMTADFGYVYLVAADQAEKTVLRGFTSVRDVAGPSFGLKRAIDTGLAPGPRIWPSGAMISQTSGHGDYRMRHEVPAASDAPLSHSEASGVSVIADGVPQVIKRVREQLMLGASQIKLAAGGGVSSNYDPLDVSQYTEAEFRAACDAAENWGTYVTIHAYTPRAIQSAVHAGVRCVEHAQLMDDETAKLLPDKGVWLCSQPFLADEDAAPFPEGSVNRKKQLQMSAGTDTSFHLARKHKLKTAWGTDTLYDARLASRQGAQLAKMKRWYSASEIMRMATGVNGELLAMSGPRNPYPEKIGVIEAGAYADLIVVNGDPLANIDLVADPDRNFAFIMKDGVIYKNAL